MPTGWKTEAGNRICSLEPPSDMAYKHLFGPIASRRLGISLGVDLVPYKYCPLNCVYCEVQSTTHLQTTREEFFPTQEIIAELDDFMKSRPMLDYITFSGAGEPTLNSGISTIIQHIKRNYPGYKLALLTNGVLLNDSEVLEEIIPCDLILPSLDSATDRGYKLINRPKPGLKVEELINGLVKLRERYSGQIWLEVFIIPGINDTNVELAALKDALLRIKPDVVQLNSLDRPGAEDWVEAATGAELRCVKSYLNQETGLFVEIIARMKYDSGISGLDKDLLSQIKDQLILCPSSAEQLSLTLNTHINEIMKYLRELDHEGMVEAERVEKGVVYTWKS